MQLGASKSSRNGVLSAMSAEEGLWGDGDLIDVNADEDDWSKVLLFGVFSRMLIVVLQVLLRLLPRARL